MLFLHLKTSAEIPFGNTIHIKFPIIQYLRI
jgi:hypothetical protein